MAFKRAKQSTSGAALAAPVLDAGSYHARLVQIIDLGLQPGSERYPDPKPRLKFTFECMDEFCYEKAEDGTFDEENPLLEKPRFFHYECTYNPDGYMGENSNIYPVMQVLSPSFLKTGNMDEDLSELLGRPVNIVLSKYVKVGGKRKGQEDNKVSGITNMKKKEFLTLKVMRDQGSPANLQLVNEPFFFDLDDPDLETFNKLNKGNQYCDQDKILASTQFPGSKLALLLGEEAPEDKPDSNSKAQADVDETEAELASAVEREAEEAAAAAKATQDDALPEDDDDDVF